MLVIFEFGETRVSVTAQFEKIGLMSVMILNSDLNRLANAFGFERFESQPEVCEALDANIIGHFHGLIEFSHSVADEASETWFFPFIHPLTETYAK